VGRIGPTHLSLGDRAESELWCPAAQSLDRDLVALVAVLPTKALTFHRRIVPGTADVGSTEVSDGDYRSDEKTDAHDDEGKLVVACSVAEPPGEIPGGETSEAAHTVDQCQAASGSGPNQEGSAQTPEDRDRCVDADRSD